MRKIIALLLVPLTLAPALAQETAPKSRQVAEAIRLSRDAKRALQELIQSMHQLSRELEKNDPQTARAIATAATKAEEAFIADDMDKVVRLLQSGLVAPADATQAQVVARLRQVLETLRSGGDDLLARLIELEKMAQMIEVLKSLIRQQRMLERQSRAIAFGDQIDAELSAAQKRAEGYVTAQRSLLATASQLKIDPVAQQLTAGEEPLRDLAKRAQGLAKSAADPYPSPELMQTNTALCRSLATETITTRVNLRSLFNEAAIAKALSDAKAGDAATNVETLLNKMLDETNKAAKALQSDNLEEAQTAIAESNIHIRETLAALEKLLTQLPAAAPVLQLKRDQQTLLDNVEGFEPELERVAPAYEKQIEAAGSRNVRPGERSPAGVATQPAPQQPEPPVIAALRQLDLKTAQTEQERLLVAFGTNVTRVTAAVNDIAALRKNPNWSGQSLQQTEIGNAIGKLAAGNAQAAAATQAATQPSTQPAVYSLPTDQQAAMGRAADKCKDAAAKLADKKPADANAVQLEIIKSLEEVLAKVQSDFVGFAQIAEEELQIQVLAFLQRIILAQKRVNADTIAIYEKRTAENTYKRTELLALAAVANAQTAIPTEIDAMLAQMKVAKSAHAIVQFPPIVYLLLQLVRTDIDTVVSNLKGNDPGTKTQVLQKDLLERLEGAMKAMTAQSDTAERPPSWGQNAIGNPEKSRVDQIAELQMMMVLQGQINRRTTDLEASRKAANANPQNISKEQRELSRLQADVRNFIDGILLDEQALRERGRK